MNLSLPEIEQLAVEQGGSASYEVFSKLMTTVLPVLAYLSYGSSPPEGAVSAVPGSIYFQSDSAGNVTLWVKTGKASNTGWTQFLNMPAAKALASPNLGSGISASPTVSISLGEVTGRVLPTILATTNPSFATGQDNVPDGSTWKRVTAVSAANQVTTPSIKAGAVSSSGQYTHNIAVTVLANTETQIATLTPTTLDGGALLGLCYFEIINQGGGSALNITVKGYKGDNTGTVLFEDDYPTVPAGANMPVNALLFDSSPPVGSQQYSVYVKSTVGFSIIAIYFAILNAKV